MRWKCPTPLHSLLLISLLVVAEAVPIDKIKSVDMEMPARDTMEPHLNGERPGFLYSRCCRDLHVNIVLQQPSEQAGGYERFHGAIQKRREFLLVSWPTISQDTGLYYDRYLREVIDVLETDKHFRERLQTADIEEIKAGKLSKELNLVSHMVRSKLDELKRQEVSRLRMLIKAKMDAHRGKDIKVDHQALLKQFDHLNHQNPHSFEAEDLEMLIKTATTDLESFDRERHEEFKQYEMLKEHERREYLKTLDEGRRKEEEMRFDEMRRKHKDHPKVHHPGSMDQLKEVWEETDGLDPDDFDPKTFFKLHDSNGDRFLDEQELEALFTKELEKIYDPNNVEDDMVEMEEERLRMREHVMNEVDVNKDRLISMEEFLNASEKKDFIDPENWETLDEQEHYSESELRQFEIQLAKQQDELNKKSHELMKQHDELRSQHDQLQAQKHELYQAMQQMEQKKHFQQQGQKPGGPKIELKFHPAEQQSNPPENLKPPTSAKANALDKVHNLIQDKAHDPVQDLNPAATTDPRHDGALH